MADQTPNYLFSVPTVGADFDLWGGFLNQNWEDIDGLLSGAAVVTGMELADVEITSGTAILSSMTSSAGSVATDAASVFGEEVTLAHKVTEGVQSVSGATPAIDPSNGGPIFSWVPDNGNNTPAITLATGQYATLLIVAGTGTYTWTGVTWLNEEPAILPNTTNVVEFFAVGATIYGAYVGAV